MTTELLPTGHDAVQCAYFFRRHYERAKGMDFELLALEKETLRSSKTRKPKAVMLGNTEFHLQPYGTASGYRFGNG